MNSLGPGSEIDGFCLGEMIHAGSMATIYRLTGRDGPLPLIIKIPRLGAGERAVNVIAFEVCRMVLGALAQGLHHPTLVAFGDVETTPYLVMEYVEGVRLNDWVQQAPIAPEEIARLGAALALALHDLHRQDVVHLDLKPTNVLYRASGEAVLIDFGLAHHSHFPDLLAEELRFPVGNWVYMSPEQVLGVRCDPRSDIYALGGILYELATGRLSFGNPRSIGQLRQRLYRDPAVPPAAALSGERYEDTATGRHIKHLVNLRRWAKPLQLPEERLTYHVLESEKPAAALIDYAKMNDVDQILMGAPRSGAPVRLFPGVSAQVVAEAPCSVTVVRPRSES